MLTIMWYLLIQFPAGDVLKVPQISKEQCYQNQKILEKRMGYVLCVPGAKP